MLRRVISQPMELCNPTRRGYAPPAMILPRRHRRLPLLHVLVLGLFVLGLVLQPAMATAGELHEFVHDPAGSHLHAQHADERAAEVATAADGQEPQDAATLHALLHFAHCCGGTAATLPSLLLPAAALLPARVAAADTSIPPTARSASPFKPPISG